MLPTHRPQSQSAWPDAVTSREKIATGQLRPSELLRQCEERIERLNGKVNALVRLDLEQARQAARQADRAAANAGKQALRGLPVSIKDAFATSG